METTYPSIPMLDNEPLQTSDDDFLPLQKDFLNPARDRAFSWDVSFEENVHDDPQHQVFPAPMDTNYLTMKSLPNGEIYIKQEDQQQSRKPKAPIPKKRSGSAGSEPTVLKLSIKNRKRESSRDIKAEYQAALSSVGDDTFSDAFMNPIGDSEVDRIPQESHSGMELLSSINKSPVTIGSMLPLSSSGNMNLSASKAILPLPAMPQHTIPLAYSLQEQSQLTENNNLMPMYDYGQSHMNKIWAPMSSDISGMDMHNMMSTANGLAGMLGMGQSSSSSSSSSAVQSHQYSTIGDNGITYLSAPLDGSLRIGAYTRAERQQRIERFRQKKKSRIWRKQIKYDCRKRLADTRPRVKGRFVSRRGDGELDEEEEALLASSGGVGGDSTGGGGASGPAGSCGPILNSAGSYAPMTSCSSGGSTMIGPAMGQVPDSMLSNSSNHIIMPTVLPPVKKRKPSKSLSMNSLSGSSTDMNYAKMSHMAANPGQYYTMSSVYAAACDLNSSYAAGMGLNGYPPMSGELSQHNLHYSAYSDMPGGSVVGGGGIGSNASSTSAATGLHHVANMNGMHNSVSGGPFSISSLYGSAYPSYTTAGAVAGGPGGTYGAHMNYGGMDLSNARYSTLSPMNTAMLNQGMHLGATSHAPGVSSSVVPLHGTVNAGSHNTAAMDDMWSAQSAYYGAMSNMQRISDNNLYHSNINTNQGVSVPSNISAIMPPSLSYHTASNAYNLVDANNIHNSMTVGSTSGNSSKNIMGNINNNNHNTNKNSINTASSVAMSNNHKSVTIGAPAPVSSQSSNSQSACCSAGIVAEIGSSVPNISRDITTADVTNALIDLTSSNRANQYNSIIAGQTNNLSITQATTALLMSQPPLSDINYS